MTVDPIFIISNPRSGSSLFRSVLNNTVYSVFPPECGFIQWLYSKYNYWNSRQIEFFVDDLLKTKKFEGWGLSKDQILPYLKDNKPNTYGEACMLIYKLYGINQGKNVKIWGDKNNYYIDYLETINSIYPNAKYIWLKRDPRDVCYSYLNIQEFKDKKYSPKLPQNIEDIFMSISSNYSKIESFLSKKPNDKFLLVEFEKFINLDFETLDLLTNFTGINLSDAFLNFNQKKYFDEPKITLDWKSKIIERIDANHVQTYKNSESQETIDSLFRLYFNVH